jgi:hypothetical protein
LYDGVEKKTDSLIDALDVFYRLRLIQGRVDDALTFAKDMYNHLIVAYNPVHPEVQKAVTTLIACLIHKGDYHDAERIAQETIKV